MPCIRRRTSRRSSAMAPSARRSWVSSAVRHRPTSCARCAGSSTRRWRRAPSVCRLIYVPGIHSATDEIVALAEGAARFSGIYASHIRGEGIHLFRGLDEAITIGRRVGLPAHVSHLKCETSLMWGRGAELLERLQGGDVPGDQYPYAAWNSTLAST